MSALFLLGGCNAETMWNPHNSVQAIDAVEQALQKMTHNPKLTPSQKKKVNTVVADVEMVVAEFQSGKKLSQKEKAAKFSKAVQELQDLQNMWANAAASVNVTAIEQKENALKKELAEKQAALKKAEDMLKLDTLQKDLLEKKLKLEKLNEQKAKQQEQEEDGAKKAMVEKLVGMAKTMGHEQASVARTDALTKGAEGKAAIQAILVDVKAREANVSAAIEKLDKEEKAKEDELDQTMKQEAPVKDKGDAIAKGKKMLQMLKKQVHREYKKAKVIKESELKELKDAVQSIEAGNVAALQKLMTKMEGEMKAADVRKHKFLV